MAGQVVETPQLDPSAYFEEITPSDDTVLENVRALWVGGAGIVTAIGADGVSADFTCGAGARLDIAPIKVMAATTATLIVALK